MLSADFAVGARRLPITRGTWVAVAIVGLAVGLLPPVYGTGIAAAVVLFVVGLARPAWPVYLLGLAAPLGSVREIRVGGIGISPTEGLVVAALISYGLVLLSRRDLQSRLSPWSAPIALFLLIGLLTTGWVTSAFAAAKELLRWVELGGAFGLVVALVRTRQQAIALLVVVLFGGIAEAALGAVQFVFRIGPPSFDIGRFLRAYGTFGQPNPYGGYLLMVLPLALALAWASLPRLRKLSRGDGLRELAWPAYTAIAAAAAAAGLGMSLSRGAWLGTAVGLLALMSAAGRRSLVAVMIGLFMLVLVAFLGAFDVLPASAVERISSITRYFGVFDVREVTLTSENWAIVERMAHWQAATNMFEAHPFVGVGIGQYPVVYEDYRLTGWDDPLGHAHNYYLNVAAETGMGGLAVYILMVASWIAMPLLLAHRAPDPLRRAIGLGVLGVVVAAGVHNLFDNLYVAGMNVHLGLLLGLAAGAQAWKVDDRLDSPSG
jgi:O-antigen ligase